MYKEPLMLDKYEALQELYLKDPLKPLQVSTARVLQIHHCQIDSIISLPHCHYVCPFCCSYISNTYNATVRTTMNERNCIGDFVGTLRLAMKSLVFFPIKYLFICLFDLCNSN
jgi:hypothetical protein